MNVAPPSLDTAQPADAEQPTERTEPPRPSRPRRLLKRLLWSFLLATLIPVLLLRWLPPPTSAFMIADRLGKQTKAPVSYRWVDWEGIAPQLALAVVAAEDQKFADHWGFDLTSIRHALRHNLKNRRLRGGSTISQQVAKNLFLWSGRSYLRKGLESYFTLLLELLWPKQRILEIYLNIAQFGDGIYGADAAARRLLNKPPNRLDPRDAALLAAVLPNPIKYRVLRPSSYVQMRQRWILGQMSRLGGTEFLRGL